jgi:hypothetical protein
VARCLTELFQLHSAFSEKAALMVKFPIATLLDRTRPLFEQQTMRSGLKTTQSGPAASQKAPEVIKARPFDAAVILNEENDP